MYSYRNSDINSPFVQDFSCVMENMRKCSEQSELATEFLIMKSFKGYVFQKSCSN